MSAISVQHQAPRLSASAAARQAACASSYAREIEYYNFANSAGLAGIVGDQAANRGTLLHKVMAAVPFSGRDFGVEPFDLRTRVVEEAGRLGTPLNGYEAFACTELLTKRNEFIEAVIDAHPCGRGGVEDVELFLDERRLRVLVDQDGHWKLPPAPGTAAAPGLVDESSGLPDVLVIVRGGGQSVGGVFDFKTGMAEYDSADNRQLDALIALLTLEEEAAGRPPLHSALASIAAESAQGEPLRVSAYAQTDLQRVRRWLLQYIAQPVQLAWTLRVGGAAEPLLVEQRALDKAAVVGSHCLNCRGKVCCGALKLKAAEFEYAIAHKYEYLLNDPKLLDPTTVNTKTLSDTLALATAIENFGALYSKLREEAETLTLQLHEKGVTVDGTVVEPGRSRVTLTETDPKKLHAQLGALTGETLDQFVIGVAGKVSATAVRAHLAEKLGLPEPKIVDALKARFDEASPLIKVPEKSSVKVTRELADIIHEVGADLRAQQTASTSGSADKPERRRRRSKEAPAAAAGIELAVAPAAETESSAVTGEAPAMETPRLGVFV
jgi:hypothetical protein